MDKTNLLIVIAVIVASGLIAFYPSNTPTQKGYGVIMLVIALFILCWGLFKNYNREGKLII